MIEIIFCLCIGIILGMISGLIPGIHSNTMAGLLLSVETGFLAIFGETAMAVSLIAALVVHTFLDIVPGTFFGIPDADTALSVLPAHRLCLKGHGEKAVRLSALGSAYGSVFGLFFLIVFMLYLPSIQQYIDWWVGIILIIVAGILIVYSESPEWSFAVFMVSGILGLFAFEYSWICSGFSAQASVLMPLLTGLFGISVLIASSDGKMPEQKFEGINTKRMDILKCSVAGTLAGSAVGWLPGLSNASANAVLASAIKIDKEGEGFIVATSAANTANAFISIAAFYAVSRMRNGVMTAFSHLENLPPISFILSAGFCAAIAGYLLTNLFSRFGKLFSGWNVRRLSFSVIIFMVVLIFGFTGPFGILILILATITGCVPGIVNIRRVPCMGSVMLPVILWSFSII
ncbi:tripartite tricarboxylate transporter permease [Methanomicrobium antiquum]|uniref:Tripartite tricarboxylate transporter permease n=1 Tax=Methanomicrobium antiquum TaxID=487686 RepID=A0AAF0JM96_9EURY|nr:tripartite tricarboxylate transporter permease [Methanomicrobium antiquum]WFN36295.1 tripartite tricarboxylate transporter permease [Methanomicrobium antiquum]